MTEFAYDASLGMLEYNFVPHTNGLYVAMNGFNDKMSVLVKHVLEKIKGIVIDPGRLAVMKEQVCLLSSWIRFGLVLILGSARLKEIWRISSWASRMLCRITTDAILWLKSNGH